MKIAVYAIALNESAHAERWANSATDADYRIVADTGSTDDTVERLTNAGVTVHRIAIRPWRFDDARNAALALIPADVDVCCIMDMDRFLEPGWRASLEAAWTPETTALYCRVQYRSHLDDPTITSAFSAKNFHSRWGYRTRRPVHEELVFTGEKEVIQSCDAIIMTEIQDRSKTTRSQYLPLMELAHREDPNDAQICFWLARECMWAKRNEQAVELLQRYLALPSSTWRDERSEAMRFLARIQPEQKLAWLDRARIEAPHRREIWLDLAEELHSKADWLNLFWACSNGIEKTHRTGSYLDDGSCWGFRLFDLGALAAMHLNMMDRAVEWGQKALDLDPNNQRLKNNLGFFTWRREEFRREIRDSSGPVSKLEASSKSRKAATQAEVPFPEVFVINLDERVDRWEAVQKTCRDSGLEPVRVSAERASPGWVGCGRSHLKAIRNAKEKGLPWVLILEDDALFDIRGITRFRALLPYLWNHRDKWERFSGGPCFPWNPELSIFDIHRQLFSIRGWNCHFDLIQSAAYDRILTWDPAEERPIDVFYCDLADKGFRSICTYPHIASQVSSISDIVGDGQVRDTSRYLTYSSCKLRECLNSAAPQAKGMLEINAVHPRWKGILCASEDGTFLWHKGTTSLGTYEFRDGCLIAHWYDSPEETFIDVSGTLTHTDLVRG